MRQVNLEEAQMALPDLVEDALAGEEVVISREGAPLVCLIPISARQPRRFGLDQGKILMRDDFDAPDHDLELLFDGTVDDPA